MGKNRVQKKLKENVKPNKNFIYSKKTCPYYFNETRKEFKTL